MEQSKNHYRLVEMINQNLSLWRPKLEDGTFPAYPDEALINHYHFAAIMIPFMFQGSASSVRAYLKYQDRLGVPTDEEVQHFFDLGKWELQARYILKYPDQFDLEGLNLRVFNQIELAYRAMAERFALGNVMVLQSLVKDLAQKHKQEVKTSDKRFYADAIYGEGFIVLWQLAREYGRRGDLNESLADLAKRTIWDLSIKDRLMVPTDDARLNQLFDEDFHF